MSFHKILILSSGTVSNRELTCDRPGTRNTLVLHSLLNPSYENTGFPYVTLLSARRRPKFHLHY